MRANSASSVAFAPGRGSIIGRTVLERRPVQVVDVLADPDYTLQEMQKKIGFRTILGVPLLRDGNPVGVIILMRLKVQPFTEKQIELATTFADQAGIAIENVRLFEEIQDKSRQVEEASKHKSQFLANMSHELRTPLNAILGYTELIIDGIYGEAPEKMRTVMERVQSNGKHLLGLINDVLDLSKIEAGQFVLSIQDYSIKDVVHGVYSAVEPLASGKKLAFKIEVPANLPPARGDDRRLTQVLLNLVGNAIKFTDTGEVAVKAAASNGSVTISVHDTGPGIAEADQRKYSKSSSKPTARRPKPKVAPASVCRSQNASSKCTAANCGSNPASAPARPSRSRCRCASNTKRGDHEQADSRRRGSGGQPSDPARSPRQCRLRHERSRRRRSGGRRGKTERPDLILMDIQLPLLDGYEATRRIKADPDLKAIPIIVVTSYALSGDEAKARAAGCDAYVTKPYSPRQLLAKIREFLPA